MKATFFLYFCLMALFAYSVNANGQVILDEIRPVMDSKVTFEDPLFTDHGAVETIGTESFAVTRQFELNVEVPDVFLTSLTGDTHFSGSQGATVRSLTGDLNFVASNTTAVVGSEITAIARDQFDITSQSGSIVFSSLFPLQVVGGEVSIDGEDNLTVFTTGELSFHAGELFHVESTLGSLELSSLELFSFESRTGNVAVGAANEMVFSAAEEFRVDATHGITVSTLSELSLISGRSTILTAITADTLVRGDVSIDYTRINLIGDDGVVVGGRRVDLDASGRVIVDSDSPGAFISADYGSQINITAANDVVFRTTGETGDVTLFATDLTGSISDDFTVNARTLYFGSNSTDVFSFDTSDYLFSSSYMSMHSEGSLNVNSNSLTSIEANNFLIHSKIHSMTASTFVTFEAADWNLFNPLGDVNGHASFTSNSDISMSSDNFVMQGAQVDGDFSSQQYFIEDLFISSSTDEDITFKAGTSMSGIIADDFTIDTSIMHVIGETDLILDLTDFQLNAAFVNMYITSAEFNANDGEVLFDSGNNIVFFGGLTSTSFSADETRIEAQGTSNVNADDINFVAGDEVEILAQKTIQLDIKEDIDLFGDLEFDANGNLYIKTSILDVETQSDLVFQTNIFNAAFGNLEVNGGDIVFEGDDLLDVLSGGDVIFNSTDDMVLSTGDDIDVTVQETLSMSAQQLLSFDADDLLLDGSQEFLFHSEGEMTMFADDSIDFNSDIFEQTSLTDFSVDATTIEIRDGSIDVESMSGDIVYDSDDTIDFISAISFEIDARIFAMDTTSFSSSSSSTNFNAASQDYSSDDTLTLATQALVFDGWKDSLSADASASITGSTSVTMATSSDQGIDLTSDTTLDITAGSNLDLLSDSDTSIWANTDLDITAVGTLGILSTVSTTMNTDNAFDAFASNKILIDAAEDASFTTNGANNIDMFSNDDINIEVGRDFHFIANGIDDTCGIAIDTINGFGFQVESLAGDVILNSYKDSLASSSSTMDFFGVGNVFMESYENGLMYFAEGTTGGIDIEATGGDSADVEFVASTAMMQFYANVDSFLFDSEFSQFTAETGILIQADASIGAGSTVSFISQEDLHVEGHRGVEFLAGLDAPVIDSDISISSGDIIIESQDLLLMQAIGTFTSTALGDTTFNLFEGNTITISAAADYTVTAENDVEFTSTGSDQTYTANDNDLTVTSADDVSIQVREGPVNIHAFAGEFLMSGFDWDITSNMDTRALALGTITLSTANNFRSLSSGTALLQTIREADQITVNADTISADSNHNGFFDVRDIEILGNNIDIVSDLVSIDATNSGIVFGDESNPIVTIIAGGDDVTAGLLFISNGDISTSTIADISVTSFEALFTLGDIADIESNGLLSMISQSDDFNLFAENGSVNIGTAKSTFAITGDHVIDTGSFSFSQFRLQKEIPINDNDLMSIHSATDYIVELDGAWDIFSEGLYELTVGGILSLTGQEVIFSAEAEDPQDETERAEMVFEMDNFDVDAVNNIRVELFDINAEGQMITGDTFDITTDDLAMQILGLGALLSFESQDSFSATSATTFDMETFHVSDLEPFVEVEADMYFEGSTISIESTDDLTITSSDNILFEATDDASLSIIGEFTVDVNTDGISTQIELSAGDNIDFTSDANFSLLTAIPPNTLPGVRDEYSILMDSDNDLSFTAATSIDLLATELNVIGGDIDFNSATLDFLPARDVIFETRGLESDVTFTSNNDIDFIGTSFTATAYGQLLFEPNQAFTLTSVDFSAIATFGDIFFDSDGTTTFTSAVGGMSFLAEGFQSDDRRAISIGDGILTFEAGGFTLEFKDKFEMEAQDTISILAPTGHFFQSSGFNSPITVDTDQGDLDITTGSNLTIEGGGGVFFKVSEFNSATTGDLTINTSFTRTGISFETDIDRNSFANIEFDAGGDINVSSLGGTARFETQYDGGIDGAITIDVDSTITVNAPVDINLISEVGDIVLATNTLEFTTGTSFRVEGNNIDIFGTSTFVPNAPQLFYNAEEIRASDVMLGTTFNAPTILLETKDTSKDNHIGFASGNTMTFNLGDDFLVHGNGGDGGILIDADFSVGSTFTATGMVGTHDYSSLSGIYITGTQHTNPDTAAITFTGTGSALFHTRDVRNSIFFQSDNDIILQAGTRIEHVNYSTRMGFFSEVPEFVQLVNLQSTEACLRGGRCSWRNNPRIGDATSAISNISSRSVLLQQCLIQFGLISWTQPLV